MKKVTLFFCSLVLALATSGASLFVLWWLSKFLLYRSIGGFIVLLLIGGGFFASIIVNIPSLLSIPLAFVNWMASARVTQAVVFSICAIAAAILPWVVLKTMTNVDIDLPKLRCVLMSSLYFPAFTNVANCCLTFTP